MAFFLPLPSGRLQTFPFTGAGKYGLPIGAPNSAQHPHPELVCCLRSLFLAKQKDEHALYLPIATMEGHFPTGKTGHPKNNASSSRQGVLGTSAGQLFTINLKNKLDTNCAVPKSGKSDSSPVLKILPRSQQCNRAKTCAHSRQTIPLS